MSYLTPGATSGQGPSGGTAPMDLVPSSHDLVARRGSFHVTPQRSRRRSTVGNVLQTAESIKEKQVHRVSRNFMQTYMGIHVFIVLANLYLIVLVSCRDIVGWQTTGVLIQTLVFTVVKSAQLSKNRGHLKNWWTFPQGPLPNLSLHHTMLYVKWCLHPHQGPQKRWTAS